jgi:hypothetical protein
MGTPRPHAHDVVDRALLAPPRACVHQVAQSERQAAMTKQRCELVMTELKSLPEDTPTYKQIGRA